MFWDLRTREVNQKGPAEQIGAAELSCKHELKVGEGLKPFLYFAVNRGK